MGRDIFCQLYTKATVELMGDYIETVNRRQNKRIKTELKQKKQNLN